MSEIIRPAVQTPHTWPENAWPTAQELGEWLKACTDEERVYWAGLALNASQRASLCRMRHVDEDRPRVVPSTATVAAGLRATVNADAAARLAKGLRGEHA